MIDLRQSSGYAKFLKSQGWIVERIKNTNYFIKRISLIGSILKVQRPSTIELNIIKNLEVRYKVFQTVVEPTFDSNEVNLLIQNGYRLSKDPYLPTKSLFLDLTRPVKTIYANFKKDCRYAIKRGSSVEIKEYITPSEIKIFHESWKKSVNFNKYVPSLSTLINIKNSYPQKDTLFLASHNIFHRIIGGAVFTKVSHKNDIVCYYSFGFTNKEGRTSLSQYSLLYKSLLWAKSNKCKLFDFEGIFDERFPNRSWLGFTHFKKSFGGNEVFYPGCYTKFRLPF